MGDTVMRVFLQLQLFFYLFRNLLPGLRVRLT